MTEIKNDFNRYQWIKGDNIGKVELVNGVDGPWTLFESGGRISTSLLDEYMTPINEGEDINIDDFSIEFQPTQNITQPVSKSKSQKEHDSPIMKLLKGMKKPINKTFTVEINVNVPSESTYDILIDSFDNANEEILKFIINQVDINKVIESVQNTIKQNYNSH